MLIGPDMQATNHKQLSSTKNIFNPNWICSVKFLWCRAASEYLEGKKK